MRGISGRGRKTIGFHKGGVGGGLRARPRLRVCACSARNARRRPLSYFTVKKSPALNRGFDHYLPCCVRHSLRTCS